MSKPKGDYKIIIKDLNKGTSCTVDIRLSDMLPTLKDHLIDLLEFDFDKIVLPTLNTGNFKHLIK